MTEIHDDIVYIAVERNSVDLLVGDIIAGPHGLEYVTQVIPADVIKFPSAVVMRVNVLRNGKPDFFHCGTGSVQHVLVPFGDD